MASEVLRGKVKGAADSQLAKHHAQQRYVSKIAALGTFRRIQRIKSRLRIPLKLNQRKLLQGLAPLA